MHDYPTTLRTSRLFLRLIDRDSDNDCLTAVAIMGDSGGVEKSGHESLGLDSVEQYRNHLDQDAPRPELCTRTGPPSCRTFLVFEGHDDTTDSIGLIGMSFRAELPFPDIGYDRLAHIIIYRIATNRYRWHIKQAYTGKGYATEASAAVLNWWRDVVGVKEIWAGMLQDNIASERIARKLGFVAGGTLQIVFPGAKDLLDAKSLVLPGMTWPQGIIVRPSLSVGQAD